MKENAIKLRFINDLLTESFFIPSYQRGYRWSETQVLDLLMDISDFSPKESVAGEKTWYCLQPVVVKHNKDSWEVIDGQQRLTTIYLILHYLNQGYVESRRRKLFNLEYETRENSSDFLKTKLSTDFIDDSNIDFLFISKAYQAISKWFIKQGQNLESSFESKILHHTKVIWYESVGDDSIDIFTRINIGKIPLTNAELIKALFLNSSNFDSQDTEKIRLRQFEIASEWDEIESSLQNERFWWFINEKESNLPSRIEFIFDLMANKTIKEKEESYTFRYFNDKFSKKSFKEINSNWQEVKKYFQTLKEWFSNRVLYHKIGFLIVTGVKIEELIKLKENKSKSQFLDELNSKIATKIPNDISELEYGANSVKNILLLHNIQSMLNNENETNLFPFDRYKKEKWDVEHISAIADNFSNEKQQEDWLKETLKFLSKDQIKEEWYKYNKDTFAEISGKILEQFSDLKEINDISNLALLDAGTNRSYKNAVFPAKRREIIKREKTGTFIPLCTKNVFMKFYSGNIEQMSFWGEFDREAYLHDIIDTLNFYTELRN
jgi:uncharacterized protein with ParB-like and HNH nuclease domain